ncbi:hypothetical protein DPMN_048386 [Dreissena polymorpha]|uniref:Myb/SANT-like DNA-binding domain-containing protein n=1 Tax=Dreissena polymorpha TaxID=45954 RepID=A0A9D4D9I5_DREPO|nr:hypothetical protein DPMN_048386 [Dreissena polymorpha]
MAKQRAPNFTLQENTLLAHLMGEEYMNFGMSRHKLDRHRFTSQISSSVKKEMWSNVETTFNANSTGPHRKGSDLEKKWENLTSTQRGIYQDHQRMLTLTASRKKALANSVDPDETPHDVASHQGLGCLLK